MYIPATNNNTGIITPHGDVSSKPLASLWNRDMNNINRLVAKIPQYTSGKPTLYHFVTDICTHVQISVTKWCNIGYLSKALCDFWKEIITMCLFPYTKIQTLETNKDMCNNWWYLYTEFHSSWVYIIVAVTEKGGLNHVERGIADGNDTGW